MPRPWRKFVPRPINWRWDIVSETFVRLQIRLGEESMSTCMSELAQLDVDLNSIQDEILSQWSTASVQVMAAFLDRLKKVKRERNIIERQSDTINASIKLMYQRGRLRGWRL
jgi:hypothetical protein